MKSSSAFRTISEVAEELDVAQHVLRFWESKFPQVRPLKRGGGRRYYRPEDVDLLRDIRQLLYQEGYTIKGAQKLLRQRRSKAARPDGALRRTDRAAGTGSESVTTVEAAESAPQVDDMSGHDNLADLRILREELCALRDLLRDASAAPSETADP
ncbi:MAG: MerR family transcriptional regulator [Geminicoccaceae bacterium]